jgi:hypothetical protein
MARTIDRNNNSTLTADASGGNNDPDQAESFDQDLANIDFGVILGGPLTAAINAQAQAAMTTVNFINSVGFDTAGSDKVSPAKEVSFSYTSAVPNADKTKPPSMQTNTLSVPLLSIVPIPYLRVQQLSVELNVKLNSVQKADTSSEVTTNTNVNSSGFFDFFSPVKFSSTIVSQNNSSTSSTINESYDLSVKMLAVQDQMPAGLAKVLQILQDSIHAPTPPTPKTP